MAANLKLMLIAGARPNFMKVAPLLKAVDRHNQKPGGQITARLVHTGQHYDARMSKVFFDELGISEPDVNLEVGSGSHAVQTANLMLKFEPVCEREKPDWLVVVGDVNSTMACTLVAAKLGIKVAHVEAGLRSFDRTMPEEINRIVTDGLADLLLTPSPDADENLKREGVPESRIRLVGNIMIDALLANLENSRKSEILTRLGIKPKAFVCVTLHRPANVDNRESLSLIIDEVKKLSHEIPVVFPMHPRTGKMLQQFGISLQDAGQLHILEPIGYHDSLCLTENARLVLTDSGGLQEESTFFKTPCLTLRPNTERPVTITVGSNRLTTLEKLREDFKTILCRKNHVGEIPALWDGKTSERVLQALLEN
jgi:UDP-N-acetylglucosamine 2-epimerase (non-hydrolysing)